VRRKRGVHLVVSEFMRLPGQQHSLMSYLRCSVPNPTWCRRKRQKLVRKKRPKIPASRRNASMVTSESYFYQDSIGSGIPKKHIHDY
jgi:hypothetical protein